PARSSTRPIPLAGRPPAVVNAPPTYTAGPDPSSNHARSQTSASRSPAPNSVLHRGSHCASAGPQQASVVSRAAINLTLVAVMPQSPNQDGGSSGGPGTLIFPPRTGLAPAYGHPAAKSF